MTCIYLCMYMIYIYIYTYGLYVYTYVLMTHIYIYMYTWYMNAIYLSWHISKSKQYLLCSERVWPQACLLPGPILNPSGLLLPMISSQVKLMIRYTFHARNMVGMMVIFCCFGDLWHITSILFWWNKSWPAGPTPNDVCFEWFAISAFVSLWLPQIPMHAAVVATDGTEMISTRIDFVCRSVKARGCMTQFLKKGHFLFARPVKNMIRLETTLEDPPISRWNWWRANLYWWWLKCMGEVRGTGESTL